jgi:uncharacterized membrane protein YkgB
MSHKTIILFSRVSLFIIYFWFGLLKVIGVSPANPLVIKLLEKTLPFITSHQFILGLGIFEMLLGILFLIGKWRRLTVILFSVHMVTTFMPLLLLTPITWQKRWVPTLEGQYIIKNLALIATYLNIYKNS